MHQALEFMRRHVGKALGLAGTKLLLFWNGEEVTQIEDPDLYQREAGPLGLPWLGVFLVPGVLGFLGLVCAGAWGALGTALRLYVGLMTLGVLPFFVTDRYRIHLVPALFLLTALAVSTVSRRLTSRPKAGVGRLLLVTLAALALVEAPLVHGDRDEAWSAARNLGIRWLEKGRPDLALEELSRAIHLGQAVGFESNLDASVVQQRAELYFNYGVALRQSGSRQAAVESFRIAAATAPENPRYVRTLADALRAAGNLRESDSLLTLVRGLAGGEAEYLVSEGLRAARAGRLAEAESLLVRATSHDAKQSGAWMALVRVQVQRGNLGRARETLARASQAGIPDYLLKAHQALVDASLGNRDAARRALEQVPPSAVVGDRTLSTVIATTRRLLEEAR
jgi:Tfp pilus assembly protein PilF